MIQPKAFGRLRPRNDQEVDDHTPGADGAIVTCADTSGGRVVAWATNGRVDKDGSVYRAVTADPDGLTLDQLTTEIKVVARLDLIQPTDWAWGDVSFHLSSGLGMIIQGLYSSIPRQYRYQDGAAFTHDMAALCRTTTPPYPVLTYDPLNPNKGYGRWVPASVIRAFLESGGVTLGYLVNQPL